MKNAVRGPAVPSLPSGFPTGRFRFAHSFATWLAQRLDPAPAAALNLVRTFGSDAVRSAGPSLPHVVGLKLLSPAICGFARTVILFSAFSCAGWLYETIDNVFAFGGVYLRAQLMLPWCPIYGIGGLLIVALMEPLRRKLQNRASLLVQVAVVAMGIYLLTGAVELAGSYISEWAMGYVPWDYSHAWGNFQGRIAPAYTLRFVVLGLVALYALHPAISRFTVEKPVAARRLAAMLVVAFVGDFGLQIAGVWDVVKDSLTVFGIKHW